MKTILVTGSTGFLGHHLVKELLKDDEIKVIAIGGRPEDKANDLPESDRLRFFPLDGFYSSQFNDIDVIINCAFPRSHDPELLAQAFDFTERVINRAVELKVQKVVNISSQGVYKRMPKGTLSKEDSPIAPIDLYSMAKYATEKMFRLSAIPHVVNVRLASLLLPQRFLYFFVKKAKDREPFTVTAPKQYASLMDVSDATAGLAFIAKIPQQKHFETYNLGIGTQYSLLEYAQSIQQIGRQFGYDVKFDVQDNGTSVCAGMDCSKLTRDTGWKPLVSKEEMITNLFCSQL